MDKPVVTLSRAVEIQFFSDFVCPWCYIGAARLHTALTSVEFTQPVRVHHAAYVLRPDNPEDGLDVMENLRMKYGEEAALQMVERVQSAAFGDGLVIDYAKMGKNYPTFRAHALLLHAEAKGTQDALKKALMRAHFVEGRNIHDVDVLVEIGRSYGFDSQEVLAIVQSEHEIEAVRRQARQAGQFINGVPYYVFNQKTAISGAQPAHVLVEAIRQAGA